MIEVPLQYRRSLRPGIARQHRRGDGGVLPARVFRGRRIAQQIGIDRLIGVATEIAQAGKAQLVVPRAVVEERVYFLAVCAGGKAEIVEDRHLHPDLEILKRRPQRLGKLRLVAVEVQKSVGKELGVVVEAARVDDAQRAHDDLRVARGVERLHRVLAAVDARLVQQFEQLLLERRVVRAAEQLVFLDDVGEVRRLDLIAAAVILCQRDHHTIKRRQIGAGQLWTPHAQALQCGVKGRHAVHAAQSALHEAQMPLADRSGLGEKVKLLRDRQLKADAVAEGPMLSAPRKERRCNVKEDHAGADAEIDIDQNLNKHRRSSFLVCFTARAFAECSTRA